MRRVKLSRIADKNNVVSFEKLINLARSFLNDVGLGDGGNSPISLEYLDEDADAITITSTDELLDAVEAFSNEQVIRMTVRARFSSFDAVAVPEQPPVDDVVVIEDSKAEEFHEESRVDDVFNTTLENDPPLATSVGNQTDDSTHTNSSMSSSQSGKVINTLLGALATGLETIEAGLDVIPHHESDSTTMEITKDDAVEDETKTSKSDTNITEMKDDSEAARVEGEQEVEVEAAIGDDATVYTGNGDEDDSKEDVEEVIPIDSNLGNNSEAESDNKLEESVLKSEEDVGSTDNKLEEDDGSTVVADATQSDESEKKAEAEQRPFIHKYYACDSCNMKPIVGTRYRAINKENLDVCEACVGKLEEQGIEFESAQDRKLRPFEVDGKTPHV